MIFCLMRARAVPEPYNYILIGMAIYNLVGVCLNCRAYSILQKKAAAEGPGGYDMEMGGGPGYGYDNRSYLIN